MHDLPISLPVVTLATFAALQVLSILWALWVLFAPSKTSAKPAQNRLAGEVDENAALREAGASRVIAHDFKKSWSSAA